MVKEKNDTQGQTEFDFDEKLKQFAKLHGITDTTPDPEPDTTDADELRETIKQQGQEIKELRRRVDILSATMERAAGQHSKMYNAKGAKS